MLFYSFFIYSSIKHFIVVNWLTFIFVKFSRNPLLFINTFVRFINFKFKFICWWKLFKKECFSLLLFTNKSFKVKFKDTNLSFEHNFFWVKKVYTTENAYLKSQYLRGRLLYLKKIIEQKSKNLLKFCVALTINYKFPEKKQGLEFLRTHKYFLLTIKRS